MKRMIVVSFILVCESLITAERAFHDSSTGFHFIHDSIIPACEDSGKKLCLHFFKKNIPTKEYSVTLKEGSFLEESFVLVDKTSLCVEAEKQKNKDELVRFLRDLQPWQMSEKEHKKHLFKQKIADDQSILKQQLGFGARMIQVYGESIPLEATGRLIFFRCQAIIGGRRVHLEVDLAHFCDVDAWVEIVNGLPTWQWQKEEEYEENYFSEMGIIDL